ncbi:MAG: UDP-N-acetylmuramoyl-tripeptide--D-alanyl-D-alanine ligase [Candidatus Omnitrophota bacterium]
MFRIKEIIKAVGGRLICGNPDFRISGVSIDSRTIKRGQLFIAISGQRFDGHNFIRRAIKRGAKAIIFSRGTEKGKILPAAKNTAQLPEFKIKDSAIRKAAGSIVFIAVSDTRKALGRLAGFHRKRFNIPVIAVTGSNGKTTVKDMLAWVLSSRLNVLSNPGTQNNDIGVPLTLLRMGIRHDIAVLELGTNHFGELAYLADIAQPNFAIITNIGPAHLENLKSEDGVYKEKLSLLAKLNPPQIAILNGDDTRLKRHKNNKRFFMITYGIKDKCDFYATGVSLNSKKGVEFFANSASLGITRLKGLKARHEESRKGAINPRRKMRLNTFGFTNVYNALAVIAVARLLGWGYRSIAVRLAKFSFPAGRLNLLKSHGTSFIDDTYNANPASVDAAISALSKLAVRGRRIFVMGDMLELGKTAARFHRQIGKQIASSCDAFIGVGKFSRLAARQALKCGLDKTCVFTCCDSKEARKLLFKTLKPNRGDLILVKGSRLMKMQEVIGR